MAALIAHIRPAMRALVKTPGFSLTVILTLALGIGGATAIFSLVEGILLRPLPFANPERLVYLGDHIGGGPNTPVTAREIATYANATTAFAAQGAYQDTIYELSGGDTPEEVNADRFNASVFSTLGVQPMLGRVFTQQEEDARAPVAVLSYALWMNRYHRDPHVLGSSIQLDRKTYSIIGVMPRSFEFPLTPGLLNRTQLWVPLSLTPEELSEGNAGSWGYHLVARLKDGVTLQQGAQDAARVSQQIMLNFPASMSAIHIRGDAQPVREHLVAEARPLLRTLFLAVSTVLLIACVNVAGLLLVRAIRRRREFAVRLALGARAGAILRESILEGLLLSAAAGGLGLICVAATLRAVVHFLPESMPRVDSIAIDGTVASFALLLALATGILCSLAPAFAALRTNLIENLKEGERTGSGAASHAWLRSSLVVAEIAIALVLLTVSGAFLRSYQKMLAVNPGFRPERVLVAGYQLPDRQYPTQESVDRFNQSIAERFVARPAVSAVGISSALPASGALGGAAYTVEGEPENQWKLKFAWFSIVDGDYFKAMGIPLIDGRYFTPGDRADAPLVVIVNQSMARHCWPGQQAIGKRVHIGNPKKELPWATVVGVVADTKLASRDQPSGDQWYFPARQPAFLFGNGYAGPLRSLNGGYIALRSALPPEQLRQTLREVVASVDPQLALEPVETMNDVISTTEAPRRFNTDLMTAFAAGALLLTIIGIYAVVAFSVSLRRQEIAIRMALGAKRGAIVRLVLVSGARVALLGCVLGVLGSLALSHLISSFLFEVSATEPAIYVSSVAVMMAMSLIACALPARRAASGDPVEALRAM